MIKNSLIPKIEEVFLKKIDEKKNWDTESAKKVFLESVLQVISESTETDQELLDSHLDSYINHLKKIHADGTMWFLKREDDQTRTDSIKFSVGDTYNRNQKPE